MDGLARELLPDEEHYTYTDYFSWTDDTRWELINGRAYAMAPGPNIPHQIISRRLTIKIGSYLEGKTCQLLYAPCDVLLNWDDLGEDADTVVQPDLVVVCDNSKIDYQRILGAPDLVVEILSPSTTRKDKVLKYEAYQSAGVREYWIIDPANKTIQVNLLKDGIFEPTEYSETDTIPVNIFDDLKIDAVSIFEE